MYILFFCWQVHQFPTLERARILTAIRLFPTLVYQCVTIWKPLVELHWLTWSGEAKVGSPAPHPHPSGSKFCRVHCHIQLSTPSHCLHCHHWSKPLTSFVSALHCLRFGFLLQYDLAEVNTRSSYAPSGTLQQPPTAFFLKLEVWDSARALLPRPLPACFPWLCPSSLPRRRCRHTGCPWALALRSLPLLPSASAAPLWSGWPLWSCSARGQRFVLPSCWMATS